MNAEEFDDRRILDAAFAAHVSVPALSPKDISETRCI
jgi:hypothetical protein